MRATDMQALENASEFLKKAVKNSIVILGARHKPLLVVEANHDELPHFITSEFRVMTTSEIQMQKIMTITREALKAGNTGEQLSKAMYEAFLSSEISYAKITDSFMRAEIGIKAFAKALDGYPPHPYRKLPPGELKPLPIAEQEANLAKALSMIPDLGARRKMTMKEILSDIDKIGSTQFKKGCSGRYFVKGKPKKCPNYKKCTQGKFNFRTLNEFEKCKQYLKK